MWNPFKNNKTDKFTQQVEGIAKKYLMEYIEQLDSLDQQVIISMPTVLGPKEYGKKELPLACAVKEAYAINPTVFACVNCCAQSASIVPLSLHKKDAKGQFENVFSHPILDLLENPNETQTQSEFMEEIVMDLLLCGNALVYKNRAKDGNGKVKKGGKVYELDTLNPDWVDYRVDKGVIVEYRGKKDSPIEKNIWDASEIIHFRLANPLNKYWGMSPIQAAARAIDVDSKILNWWLETLENGCVKDVLFKTKHDLNEKQLQRVRSLVQQQLTGWANGRGYMILGHEFDAQFLNMNPKEMDFTGSRQLSSKEIMRIFRVPPPMLGELEHSTYNNIKEARQSFWLDTIMPILNDICAVFTKRLVPDFGLDIRNYYISYDAFAIEALERLYLEKWDYVVKMVNVGVPLNIAVKRLNLQLPPIAGGDVGYMSHNLVPLGFWEDPTKVSDNNGSSNGSRKT